MLAKDPAKLPIIVVNPAKIPIEKENSGWFGTFLFGLFSQKYINSVLAKIIIAIITLNVFSGISLPKKTPKELQLSSKELIF